MYSMQGRSPCTGLLKFILSTETSVFILKFKLDNVLLLSFKTKQNKAKQKKSPHKKLASMGLSHLLYSAFPLQTHPTANFLLAAYCASVILLVFFSVLQIHQHKVFTAIMFSI